MHLHIQCLKSLIMIVSDAECMITRYLFSSSGAVVAMKTVYTFVNESSNNVSVCAVVKNQASIEFSFTLHLLFGSPHDSASA